MDWVHCNNCCVQPCEGPEKPRYFLTNCGHIICKQCSMECANNKCRICGSAFKSVPLTSKMKPEIERFFMNPLELLKRSLAEVQTVTDFQHGHRTRLMDHLRKRIQLQDRMVKELDGRCRAHEARVRKLEEQLRQARPPNVSPSGGGFLSGAVTSRPFRRTPQGSTCVWPPGQAPRDAGAGEPRISPYMDMARRHFQPSPSSVGSHGRSMQASPSQRPSQTLLAKLFASPGVPKAPNFI